MLNTFSPTALANRFQQLLDERQQHEDAIEQIDQTLESIYSLVGMLDVPAKRGRKPRAAAIQGSAAQPKKLGRGRGEYATTAVESILGLVKRKGNPATQEIKALWKQEGRGGSADNVLCQLVKDKKLKRTPIKDQRGSYYSLA